jgi:hypothetical protein
MAIAAMSPQLTEISQPMTCLFAENTEMSKQTPV